MTVLNIDMDYFLNKIHYATYDDNNRLDSREYKVWEKEEFKYFIENVLGLSKNSKILGRISIHHNEAFYHWREMI